MTILFIIGIALSLLGAGLSFFRRDRLTWSVLLASNAFIVAAFAAGGHLWAVLVCAALGVASVVGLANAIRQARRAR